MGGQSSGSQTRLWYQKGRVYARLAVCMWASVSVRRAALCAASVSSWGFFAPGTSKSHRGCWGLCVCVAVGATRRRSRQPTSRDHAMRLVSTVVDRVGVCEEVCGVQVEYNPSRPASLSRPKRAAASAALQAIDRYSATK